MNDPYRLQGKAAVKMWLFNPFHFVAGGSALAVGLVVILVAGLNSSLSHSHFDGVLDFHTGLVAPLWFHVAEGFVAWLAMGALLYAAGLLMSRSRIRAIDVFGTQALARVPTLISAALAMAPGYQRQVARFLAMNTEAVPADIAVFATVVVLGLLMLVWMVVLMYRAFALSCNVSGWKAISVFAFAVLVGEVISKVQLMALMTYIR